MQLPSAPVAKARPVIGNHLATVTVVVVPTAVESECEHAVTETSIIAVATQRAPRVPARATRGA